MKHDLNQACQVTGFVPQHARACQLVAGRTNCIILFREPGVMAQGLIADNYCMKGFRIDTKSCNWGPMSGFVCADPRLTKDSVYEARNVKWTEDALSGHIEKKFFGDVKDADWVGDVMPIVISKTRIEELTRKGVIHPAAEGNDWVGESVATKGTTVLYWRLVPAGNASNPWLKAGGGSAANYYVVCVNTRGARPFKQQLPHGVQPILFRGYEAILGLINPGTKQRGFKACVTADYDLFAIWPGTGKDDRMALQHNVANEIARKFNFKGGQAPMLSGGVARMDSVDTRLQAGGYRESHRFGDVSARVLNVKVLLNTALQTEGGYQGGNAVHHHDEAGNFALAKGSLTDCLPLIGFLPSQQTVLIENLKDFAELVQMARAGHYDVRAKADWLKAAGVGA